MDAKEWLRKNEWPDLAINNEMHTQHYTYMHSILQEFAKEYMKSKLNGFSNSIRVNKYI